MVKENKVLKFFNDYWLLLSILSIFVVITVKVYDNGVITGEWAVCTENKGVMLKNGECIGLEITSKGYSVCKGLVYDNGYYDSGFLNVSI